MPSPFDFVIERVQKRSNVVLLDLRGHNPATTLAVPCDLNFGLPESLEETWDSSDGV